MSYFSVKDFDHFQHYKDRNPPWIKLYNELLDNYEFGLLSDASKLHLILIWLLASRSENKLPYDSEWVGRRINATEKVDLESLVQAGFIVTDQPVPINASKVLAKCLPRDREERETERETEQKNTAYAVCLNVVKLTQKGYQDWSEAFPHVPLKATLAARDAYLSALPVDDPARTKWFMTTAGYLKNEETKALASPQKQIMNGIRPAHNPFPKAEAKPPISDAERARVDAVLAKTRLARM